ncbi:MAG: YbhB/YbcL family Raf kinase inhibitor-like protein [Rhizobiales bacterium]|nr:YbhB/YbcL family Raf kinase inhibitor-like protein [Hyphomicrobiales bacterium]MBI3672697.1 YbhB/YbcL family Raf kinase inhibitor-like protein [Hyphomicrobiales bacterium]
MTLQLTSSAFRADAPIPVRHTCNGPDLSPPLSWSGVPAAAKSLAFICEDPDAPVGTFYHWGLYDLPTTLASLGEGASIPTGAKAARNDFGSAGYRGPCPPKGHGIHHYHFRLFALSVPHLTVLASAGCKELFAALRPHVLASAELVGTFRR